MGMMVVRRLTSSDIGQARELSRLAGWNQLEADWARLMRLAPESCWCVEQTGGVASTTCVIKYGEVAWIGMVLTHPEHRNQGLARGLMQHALEYCDTHGLRTLKLDATHLGKPLYAEMGFEEEELCERWVKDGAAPSPLQSSRPMDIGKAAVGLDSISFGADRSELLRELANAGAVFGNEHGCVFLRSGRVAHHLGPCVAESPEIAERLAADATNAIVGERCIWDLLPANHQAVDLARQLGFEKQRTLWRMRRGAAITTRPQMQFAIAGFELG